MADKGLLVPWVMDNRFFLFSLVLVGLVALFGLLLLPLVIIFLYVFFARRMVVKE